MGTLGLLWKMTYFIFFLSEMWSSLFIWTRVYRKQPLYRKVYAHPALHGATCGITLGYVVVEMWTSYFLVIFVCSIGRTHKTWWFSKVLWIKFVISLSLPFWWDLIRFYFLHDCRLLQCNVEKCTTTMSLNFDMTKHQLASYFSNLELSVAS